MAKSHKAHPKWRNRANASKKRKQMQANLEILKALKNETR
jgi:hypothetical protein